VKIPIEEPEELPNKPSIYLGFYRPTYLPLARPAARPPLKPTHTPRPTGERRRGRRTMGAVGLPPCRENHTYREGTCIVINVQYIQAGLHTNIQTHTTIPIQIELCIKRGRGGEHGRREKTRGHPLYIRIDRQISKGVGMPI